MIQAGPVIGLCTGSADPCSCAYRRKHRMPSEALLFYWTFQGPRNTPLVQMKKIQVKQEFDVPLQKLLDARQERYKHLDKFPELKNVHIEEETREGDTLKQVRHIAISESLPQVVATLLPSGADTLVETSTFLETTHIHNFRVVPGGDLDHLFVIEGESKYYELDGNRAARDYDIKVTSKAFLVSGLVESAIADVYAKQLEKDKKSILNFIEVLEKESGGES